MRFCQLHSSVELSAVLRDDVSVSPLPLGLSGPPSAKWISLNTTSAFFIRILHSGPNGDQTTSILSRL